jgi:predicted short-subunit dehydrogenase-like oxidoreductase (DUF2520 family)
VRSPLPAGLAGQSVAVVGAGRLGLALATALRAACVEVSGPHGRGFDGRGVDIVLLCVPDDHIAEAASVIAVGPYLGHCSGATSLAVLRTGAAPGRAFSIHPLITATPTGTRFAGASAAVAGGSEAAVAVATGLADALGMRAFSVADDDRPAYHAAAAMAANFLVTLEWAAARLLASASVDPSVVVPLARQALDNWADLGPGALTGPVARGDLGTVAAQREAVADRTPDLLGLFDQFVLATRALAISRASSLAVPTTAEGS